MRMEVMFVNLEIKSKYTKNLEANNCLKLISESVELLSFELLRGKEYGLIEKFDLHIYVEW